MSNDIFEINQVQNGFCVAIRNEARRTTAMYVFNKIQDLMEFLEAYYAEEKKKDVKKKENQ